MKNALTLLLLVFCFAKSQSQSVTLTPLNAPNTLNWLIGMERAPGDNRIYAVQKDGFIRIVNPDGSLVATPFLDLSAKVNNSANNEQGLLGLAFHPNYQQNGLFYVFYNEIGTGKCIISRFLRSLANPDQGNIVSEGILLAFDHPGPYHVGGCIKFGPDGYLYVSTGDGGGGGDPNGNGQNLLSFMGKILRLQVGSGAYSVPAANPFVGVANTAPEIWAYGLRNPWRFNFDSFTGDLWIGDVGQDTREEVNFQASNSTGGENYGWSCYEGTLPFNSNQCFAGSVYTDPLYEYDNAAADCSVTGGTVYRGTQFADLFGKYFFTDFCSGKIRSVLNDGIPTVAELGDFNNNNFTSLEAGPDGELYVTGFNDNIIYKVKSTNCAPVAWLVAEPNITLPIGGSAQLNVYGNNMNYQWLLDGSPINVANANSLTVNASGTYSVVVTNPVGGCSNTSNSVNVIAQYPLLNATATAYDVPCFGDSSGTVTVIAVGGNENYTYLWSNGETTASIDSLVAGEYTVTVSDTNGSSVTATGTVNQPDVMTVTVDPEPFSETEGYINTFVSGGVPPYFLLWNTGATINPLVAPYGGPYSVTVVDNNGCVSSVDGVYLLASAEETLQEINLKIQPNPLSEELRVSLSLASPTKLGIRLLDNTGRQVMDLLPFGQLATGEKTVQASTEALPPGVYFVVVNVDGKMAARKVVKI